MSKYRNPNAFYPGMFECVAFYEECRTRCLAYSLEDARAYGDAALRQGWSAYTIADHIGNDIECVQG